MKHNNEYLSYLHTYQSKEKRKLYLKHLRNVHNQMIP